VTRPEEHVSSTFDTVAEPLRGELQLAADAWDASRKTARLWSRDASLWTGADEARWMGWLTAPEDFARDLGNLQAFSAELRAEGLRHVLLLGMGGSSLCPEVLAETFGQLPGGPRVHVLDSTVPAEVAAIEHEVDLPRTLVIVASKSGSTLEPNIFHAYFYDRMVAAIGREAAGRHFVAITDPGSKLETVATRDGFRRIFAGIPSIGGRYSALSPFGLVPAAAMGLDLPRWYASAASMATMCGAGKAARENPGVSLGLLLGTCANHGLDKLTLIVSPRIYDLGAWLEQLIAESTGKIGRALIPVDREAVAAPNVYSHDRVFAYVRLTSAPDDAQDAAVEALVAAGRPVVRLDVAEPYGLAGEFFRWEIATAVAGSVMGINPFDQPDVEASKMATRKLTSEFEATGALSPESPVLADDGMTFFTDNVNADALRRDAGEATARAWLKAHLDRLGEGDYFALLAYIAMSKAHEARLQSIRMHVRDKRGVATCLGFGPRFLHSTGQAYKGGPNSGVFLQVMSDDAVDLPVPGARYSFGVVKAAQARGDFQVLVERGRRALRLHLGADVETGLNRLELIVSEVL
jgi:transaldolase / glucose-6-phosphate isomerase